MNAEEAVQTETQAITHPIQGRVAEIVSLREVAINRGYGHGVRPGMVFAILAEAPITVTDPETKKDIGRIDREKVRVRATEVTDSFSVCSTFEEYVSGFDFSSINDLFAPRTRKRTLKVGDSDLPPPLPEEDSYVKVNDRVRQVNESSD